MMEKYFEMKEKYENGLISAEEWIFYFMGVLNDLYNDFTPKCFKKFKIVVDKQDNKYYNNYRN